MFVKVKIILSYFAILSLQNCAVRKTFGEVKENSSEDDRVQYVASSEVRNSLTPQVQKWIYNEQKLIDRSFDPSLVQQKIETPYFFGPESGNTFRLQSYWIPEEKLALFDSSLLSESASEAKLLRGTFYKEISGKKFVRFFVHPDSQNLYKSFVANAEVDTETWYATATMSFRTVFAWSKEHPANIFFVKMAVDKEVDGVRRVVSHDEVQKSAAYNSMFASFKPFPKSFLLLPEPLTMYPKGMTNSGMIVRSVPDKILKNADRYIPFFSLYAEKNDQNPLLVDMILKSKLSVEEFIREKIVRPFLKDWIQLAVYKSAFSEPHSQNVLLEVDEKNSPTGKFLHKDLGGFYFDMREAKFCKLSDPRFGQEIVSDRLLDQEKIDNAAYMSLEVYFRGGVAYNFDRKIPEWMQKGLLPKMEWPEFHTTKMFRSVFREEYEKMFSLPSDYNPSLGMTLNNRVILARNAEKKRLGEKFCGYVP